MDNKNLTLEELKAEAARIADQIEALEDNLQEEEEILDVESTEDEDIEDEDTILVESDEGFNWKKVAGVAGVVAAVGAGVFLVAKKPWQSAKIAYHLVHIV